ncbi:MAG: hypothetical protein JHD28_05350 [Bacteroidia bacterium]|nr:hypothetical protein [Bacteroidia bacterium]
MNVKPKLNRYRNSEFIQYLRDTVTIFKAFDLKALKLEAHVSSIESNIADLDKVFVIASKNGNTDALETADVRRDDAVIGIRTVAVGYERSHQENIRTAAKTILALMDKFGTGIAAFGHIAETNAITSIVKELETVPEAADAVTTLNLLDWITELKEANITFNDIFIARNKDIADQPDQNLKELRTPAMASYNNLINKTEAYFSITENPPYKDLLNQIDTIVLKYNASVPKPVAKTPPVVK